MLIGAGNIMLVPGAIRLIGAGNKHAGARCIRLIGSSHNMPASTRSTRLIVPVQVPGATGRTGFRNNMPVQVTHGVPRTYPQFIHNLLVSPLLHPPPSCCRFVITPPMKRAG